MVTKGTTIIKNAKVLDVETGKYNPHCDIIVEDGIISKVTPKVSENETNAEIIDVKGAAVVPGFIDCHVHVTSIFADLGELTRTAPSYVTLRTIGLMEKTLQRGFTTVRDAGGADYGLAEAVEEGLIAGPRLIHGSKILSPTGGHGDFRPKAVFAYDNFYFQPGAGTIVDGVTEVRKACRHEIRQGARHIKFCGCGGCMSPNDTPEMDQFSSEEIAAMVEEANMANIYCCGHLYSARSINRALRLGVRSIEHGNYIDDEGVELMLEKNAFIVPTNMTDIMIIEMGKELGIPDYVIEKEKRVVDAGYMAMEKAYKHNLQMAFGTDLIGADMQEYQNREFTVRSQFMPAIDIIRSATTVAAKLIRMEEQIGQVKEGFEADLLVIEGDPLEDISILEKPEESLQVIMKGGKLYKNTYA